MDLDLQVHWKIALKWYKSVEVCEWIFWLLNYCIIMWRSIANVPNLLVL